MREDTQFSFGFQGISGKKVEADFTGGVMTSDAGVLVVRELAEKIHLIDLLADAISDERHPGYVRHDVKSLLTQRTVQIACGYEDADDCDALRTDPGFKAACGKLPSEPDLASQPTMSRFENAVGTKDLYRIAQVFVDQFIASYETPPDAIVLDIDDTDDPTHGAQQLSLFNAYYDEYCFQPIVVFEGRSGKLITSILRPGRRPSGREACAILKRIIKRIRAAWPRVGILVRGDSHYSSPELFSWCDAHNVHYILGLTSNSTLKARADAALKAARRDYETSGEKARVFRQVRYQASSWNRALRIIIMAEVSRQGDNIRFLVTSMESSRPSFLYETAYCGRGQMENFIKDLKLALASGRTSCHRFLANSFRLLLHSAAYVILHTLREKGLAGTSFAAAQFDTIRLRLLKIGAEARELKTKLHFRMPTSFPLQEVFATMYARVVSAP